MGMALALAAAPCAARANVYATNVKLNDGTANVTLAPGGTLIISYILNDDATQGVNVNILAGTNVLRTLSGGTTSGYNWLVWDGLDGSGNTPAPGTYSVSITAAATGYSDWQVTDDGSSQIIILNGNGIAVDRNPASPYYGRILVANSIGSSSTDPTQNRGILKWNADGSAADEGIYSAGGLNWSDAGPIPWKIAVSDDDYVYVSDAANGGAVYRWDPTIAPGGQVYVVRPDNRATNTSLSGLAVVGCGTNTQIWIAYTNTLTHAFGLLKWAVTTNGTCASNDLGTVVVRGGVDLGLFPSDVSLDAAGNIYTCQPVSDSSNSLPRVLRFPAYDPSTNGGLAESKAAWATGGANVEYVNALGIAAGPGGTYVAAAFWGLNTWQDGNTKVLYATNGALVANLDLGAVINGNATHQDLACAWDAVGNVYYVDDWAGHWLAVSPPGANQATTVAVPIVQIAAPPPDITSITVSNGFVTIDFTAQASDSAQAFTLLTSATPTGGFSTAASATITRLSAGVFQAAVPTNGPTRFYRLQR